MAEKWLSIVEYARTYNVSDMTVRRRIKTGKLNAVLQDGKYFIPTKDESKPVAPQVMPRRPVSEMQVIKAHPQPQQTFHQAAVPTPQPRHHLATTYQPPQRVEAAYEAPRGRHVGIQTKQESIYAEPNYPAFDDDSEPNVIPASLRRAFAETEAATVDARALLAFCEASMKKHQESERRQVERFKAKLETLEATVAARDAEAKNLKQQLEDLQLLVKVLERKRQSA